MVATPMIAKMFAGISVTLTQANLYKVSLGIYALFTIFYFVVYKITAQVYYKIIK